MIIIAGVVDFDTAENRDRAIELSIPLQESTRTEEPGCLAYCFAADPCVDNRVQVYELWSGEEALAAHFEHENYLNMRSMLGTCGITGPGLDDPRGPAKYRCDLSEPVYDQTMTPRADFFTD